MADGTRRSTLASLLASLFGDNVDALERFVRALQEGDAAWMEVPPHVSPVSMISTAVE